MKSRLLGAACILPLVVLANTAHAVIINPILGLDIGGTLYDVTFHDGIGDSFNALWDADDDGAFGGGASVFSAAPTFWGDESGAGVAAAQIIDYLGDVNQTTAGSDAFLVPWTTEWGNNITADPDDIQSATDHFSKENDDFRTFKNYAEHDTTQHDVSPYASFQVSSVPVPAAVWLFGSGLLGLVGMARRKKAA